MSVKSPIQVLKDYYVGKVLGPNNDSLSLKPYAGYKIIGLSFHEYETIMHFDIQKNDKLTYVDVLLDWEITVN